MLDHQSLVIRYFLVVTFRTVEDCTFTTLQYDSSDKRRASEVARRVLKLCEAKGLHPINNTTDYCLSWSHNPVESYLEHSLHTNLKLHIPLNTVLKLIKSNQIKSNQNEIYILNCSDICGTRYGKKKVHK